MMRINVPETCAGATVTRDDGKALRGAILRCLDDEGTLELDFGGQRVASASFFDESLGSLAESLGVEVVRTRISVVGIEPGDRDLLNRIIRARVARSST